MSSSSSIGCPSGSAGRCCGYGLPGLLLIIKTADCLPVLLVDESRRVIAAVHCGWSGTLQLVLEKVVLGMMERYGCRNADLLAGFGPCIGGDCYEVGEDVRRGFAGAGFPAELFEPSKPEEANISSIWARPTVSSCCAWVSPRPNLPPRHLHALRQGYFI